MHVGEFLCAWRCLHDKGFALAGTYSNECVCECGCVYVLPRLPNLINSGVIAPPPQQIKSVKTQSEVENTDNFN